MRILSSFLLYILAISLPFLRHTNANTVAVSLAGVVVLASANAASNFAHAAATTSTTGNDDDDDGAYESKIQQALQYFQTKSSQLIKQAMQEGGGGGGGGGMVIGHDASTAEIDPNGGVGIGVGGDDDTVERELREAEFALAAMKQELSRLQDRLISSTSKQQDENDSEDHQADDNSSDDDDDDDDDDEEDEHDDDDDDDDEDDYDNRFPPENYRLTSEEMNAQLQNDPELKAILDEISDPSIRKEKYGDIKSEADMASNMDIDYWHKFKYWQLHAYFSCARQFTASRPVYDTDMWNELRQLWNEFAKEDKLDNFKPGMTDRTYQFSTDSFDPPMEAFHAGEKGRGLRAARDIAKGELVFKATNNTVIFTHGHTWRKFLFHIFERHGEDGPTDGGMACDVLLWSWVQRLEMDGPLVIVADFDNGSLLNEGRDEIGWDKPNVRCGKEGDEMCMMEYYATDDIKTGDEILCDYRGFALLGAWRNMGL